MNPNFVWTAFKENVRDSETWEKVKRALVIQKASAQWKEKGGRYIPSPVNYLSKLLWLDTESFTPDKNDRPITEYKGEEGVIDD